MNKKMVYLIKENNYKKVIRTEILFTPILVILPLIISVFLINDWYVRGFLMTNSAFNGELMLGIIILIGNIIFDLPFLKSLIRLYKNKR